MGTTQGAGDRPEPCFRGARGRACRPPGATAPPRSAPAPGRARGHWAPGALGRGVRAAVHPCRRRACPRGRRDRPRQGIEGGRRTEMRRRGLWGAHREGLWASPGQQREVPELSMRERQSRLCLGQGSPLAAWWHSDRRADKSGGPSAALEAEGPGATRHRARTGWAQAAQG